jgi:hypothetical protein
MSPRRCYLLSPLLLLLLIAFIGRDARPQPAARNADVSFVGRGLPFAIADFDGDHRPDIASFEMGRSGSRDHWVELELTATGWQAIRFVAPEGGFVIEARDVNADDAVDLVVASAQFQQPVAVFLNDGRGHFSQAEPSRFTTILNRPATRWALVSSRMAEAVTCRSFSRSRLRLPKGSFSKMQVTASWLASPAPRLASDLALLCHAGRAPPSGSFLA